jgi:hypothetical protein
MIRIFHPCQFNFENEDIRVVGSTISGGTSLSGLEDVTETSGGGFWRADFSGADFGGRDGDDRAATLAWRALQAGQIGGSVPVDVVFCDALHQPVVGTSAVPHSDETPFSDASLYEGEGAEATVRTVVNGQVSGLRATVLELNFAGGQALLGGEKFTLVHPTWGPRAYEIYDVEVISGGVRVTFQPPVRGGVAVGDGVDFGNVRCRMRRVSEATSAISIGVFSTASISFQEDMRRPPEPEDE